MTTRSGQSWLLFASFTSGFAALGYEMLWTRIVTYLIGSDAYALGIVLGLFSVSLAAGAVAGGRLLGGSRPLRAYALVESTIAVVGAVQAAAWLFARQPAAVALSRLSAHSSLAGALACGVALVVLPGVIMGTTLPLLVAALHGPFGVRNAYASNVLGAFAGAIAVGGVAFSWFTVSGGFGVAIAANLAAAGSAALVRDEQTAPAGEPISIRALLRPSVPGACAFLAGVASFALEVLLFRVLRARLTSSCADWSVALLVGLFLAGLAIGSRLYKGERGFRSTVFLSLPSVVIALMLVFFATSAPEAMRAVSAVANRWQLMLLVVLVTSIAAPFGYLFPYLVGREVALGRVEPRTATARILVNNSIGNLCGSVGAGFAVVPTLGSGRGLALPMLMVAIVAAVLPGRLFARRVALLTSGGVAALALFFPVRLLLPIDQRASLAAVSEDPFGNYTLQSIHPVGFRLLRYGQPVSGTQGDQLDNIRFVFDLIELSGKARSQIIAAGLGGACHLREAALRSVGAPELYQHLRVIEISPAVIGLARAHYRLPDSAFSRVERDDYRRKLREGSADVQVVDLLSPAVDGLGGFFTVEFHEEARRSLTASGMLVQWLGRFAALEFLPEITRTVDTVYGGGYVLRTEAGHYMYAVMREPEENSLLGERLAILRARYAANGSPGFEFWSTRGVLERLKASSTRLITEDRIPFGRLFVASDHKPAFARDVLLREHPVP